MIGQEGENEGTMRTLQCDPFLSFLLIKHYCAGTKVIDKQYRQYKLKHEAIKQSHRFNQITVNLAQSTQK